MINILICDDDKIVTQHINKIIKPLVNINEIYIVNNGSEAIGCIKNNKVDILITDIDMPHINGIDASNEILSYNPNIQVIFITGHKDYIFDAISIRPLDFITKPINNDRLIESVNIAVRRCNVELHIKEENTNSNKFFEFTFNKNKHMISYEDIIMFRNNLRKVELITKNDNVMEFYMKFSELENLVPDNFIKIHKSYIVNLNYVSEIISNKTVIFYNSNYSGKIAKDRLNLLKYSLTNLNNEF